MSKVTSMNAARKAKKAMLTAANDGIETFGPRKGENMTYWRAVSILTALCTIITAGETNVDAAPDQAARDEHVRKTTVKEIWGDSSRPERRATRQMRWATAGACLAGGLAMQKLRFTCSRRSTASWTT